jgi:hypothetical protein
MGLPSIVTNPIGTISGYLGQQVAQDPGGAPTLNTQAAQDQAYQQYLQAQQQAEFNRQAAAFNGQNQLATNYQGTITGTAPNSSVALTQLGSGLAQIQGAQNAAAAGASGENAVVARRTAAQNIAGQQQAANAQQAQIRAQETAAAQSGLSNLYANQQQAANTGMATDVSGTTAAGNTTEAGQAAIEDANAKAKQANAKQNSSLLTTIGGAIGL